MSNRKFQMGDKVKFVIGGLSHRSQQDIIRCGSWGVIGEVVDYDGGQYRVKFSNGKLLWCGSTTLGNASSPYGGQPPREKCGKKEEGG